MKKNHIFKKIVLSGIVVISGILNGYGQESACLCQPDNDTDYVVPTNATAYSSSPKIENGVWVASTGGITITNDFNTNGILHLTGTGQTYTLNTGSANSGTIYVHEGVTLIIAMEGLNGLNIYNRGSIISNGKLSKNGATFVNAGVVHIRGEFGPFSGAFSNYGIITVDDKFSLNGGGNPLCWGDGAIMNVGTFGDINGNFGGIGGGGTINVTTGFGAQNNSNAFDLAEELVICATDGATLPTPSQNWTVTIQEDCHASDCNFFPTISPTTFKVGVPNTFTAALRGEALTENDIIYWLVNDNLIKTGNSTDATFEFTPGGDTDKVRFIIERGDCKKMSNGVTMSTAASVDAPGIELDWKDGTITNDTIKVCSTANITVEAFSRNAGLYPQYQWKINNGGFSPATLNKDTTFAPAELNDGDMIIVQLIPDVAMGGLCNGGEESYPTDWILTDTLWIKTVSPAPPTFTKSFPSICAYSTPPLDLNEFVSPEGGTFSGYGVSGSEFILDNAYTNATIPITYTLTDSETGCESSAIQDIVIGLIPYPELNVSFPGNIFNVHLNCSTWDIDKIETVTFQYRKKGSDIWLDIITSTVDGSSTVDITDSSDGKKISTDKTLTSGTWEFRAIFTTPLGCTVTTKTELGVIRCADCKEATE